jgi:hypothetical protein
MLRSDGLLRCLALFGPLNSHPPSPTHTHYTPVLTPHVVSLCNYAQPHRLDRAASLYRASSTTATTIGRGLELNAILLFMRQRAKLWLALASSTNLCFRVSLPHLVLSCCCLCCRFQSYPDGAPRLLHCPSLLSRCVYCAGQRWLGRTANRPLQE